MSACVKAIRSSFLVSIRFMSDIVISLVCMHGLARAVFNFNLF